MVYKEWMEGIRGPKNLHCRPRFYSIYLKDHPYKNAWSIWKCQHLTQVCRMIREECLLMFRDAFLSEADIYLEWSYLHRFISIYYTEAKFSQYAPRRMEVVVSKPQDDNAKTDKDYVDIGPLLGMKKARSDFECYFEIRGFQRDDRRTRASALRDGMNSLLDIGLGGKLRARGDFGEFDQVRVYRSVPGSKDKFWQTIVLLQTHDAYDDTTVACKPFNELDRNIPATSTAYRVGFYTRKTRDGL